MEGAIDADGSLTVREIEDQGVSDALAMCDRELKPITGAIALERCTSPGIPRPHS